jgi:hypothetical protein
MSSEKRQYCRCVAVACYGPALLAAGVQYRHELPTAGGNAAERCHTEAAGAVLQVLIRVVAKLKGDVPVVLDFGAEARDMGLDQAVLEERVTWLVDHRYLALEGPVDGILRLWVNPSVAFLPRATDPRVAAARHRFPYIVTDDEGMASEQPVHVVEYDEQGWERVYRLNVEQIEDPPRLSYGCPLHHVAGSMRLHRL